MLAMRSRKNQDNQPAINGSVNFSPGHPLHSGNALADALLGNFNNYTEARPAARAGSASASSKCMRRTTGECRTR